VIHNTLVVSDYGLLDQKTLIPRPNYWGALLWRRLMGTTVLDSGVEIAEGRHVYAHCLRGAAGGVTPLVINNSRTETTIEAPLESMRYTLSAEPLRSGDVELNGAALKVDDSGDLPAIEGAATAPGSVSFAPGTITFLAIERSGNSACRGS
jgi:heparanase 1